MLSLRRESTLIINLVTDPCLPHEERECLQQAEFNTHEGNFKMNCLSARQNSAKLAPLMTLRYGQNFVVEKKSIGVTCIRARWGFVYLLWKPNRD